METEREGEEEKREGERENKNNKISSLSSHSCERYKTQYTGLSGSLRKTVIITTDTQFLIYDASIQKA